MTRVIFAAVILSVVLVVGAQQVTLNYHLGGSNTSPQNVPFTFSRSGDVTTVSWDQFAASADSAGVIYSAATDTYPAGYPISNLYGANTEALVRWSYIFENGNGYLQLSATVPYVTFRPNAGTFSAGQIITVRSGSMKFYNKDVSLPGTTNSVLATTLATSIASTTSTQVRSAGVVSGACVGVVLMGLLASLL